MSCACRWRADLRGGRGHDDEECRGRGDNRGRRKQPYGLSGRCRCPPHSRPLSLSRAATMTSLFAQASTSPSPYAPSVLCCPASDDAFAATKEAAADAPAQQLAELTLESPCIPLGVACAASALPAKCDDAAAAAVAASSSACPVSADRLAAVNAFTLNVDEPKRSMQELVHALMHELEGGHQHTQANKNRTEAANTAVQPRRSTCSSAHLFFVRCCVRCVLESRQEEFGSSVQHHDVVRRVGQ